MGRRTGPAAALLVAGLLGVALAMAGEEAAAQQGGQGGEPRETVQVPVHLYADYYRASGDRLEAEGNVFLTFEDYVVQGDRVVIDSRAETAYVEGNVRVTQGGQSMAGKALKVDLARERWEFIEPRGELWFAGLKEPVFVEGRRAVLEGGRITVVHSRATTCDEPAPHYHLEARELVIYPGQNVILRGVSYWEGRVPVYYWPQAVLPMRGSSPYELPEVSYSEEEGLQLKLSHPYYVGPGVYGAFDLEGSAFGGAGAGLRHVYRDDDTGRSMLYGRFFPNRATGRREYTLGWKHWGLGRGGPLLLDFSVEGEAGGAGAYRTWKLDAWSESSTGGARTLLDLRAEHRTPALGEGGGFLETTLLARRSLLPGLSLRLAGDADHLSWSGQGPTLEQFLNGFNYSGELSLNPPGAGYQASLVLEQWEGVARSPEVNLEWLPSFTTRLWPVSLRGQVGSYREKVGGSWGAGDDTETWRASAEVSLVPRTLVQTPVASLLVSAFAREDRYGTGHEQRTLSGRTSLLFHPSASFLGELRLTDQQVQGGSEGAGGGFSPFHFDRQGDMLALDGRALLRRGPLSLELSGTYDFRAEEVEDRFGPLYALAALRSGSWWAQLGARYNLREQEVDRLVGLALWQERRPREWVIGLGASYDPAPSQGEGPLRRVDGILALPVTKEWWVELQGSYRPREEEPSRRFAAAEIAVANLADCRELRFRYDVDADTFWVEYEILAFPRIERRQFRERREREEEDLLFDPGEFTRELTRNDADS